MKRPRPSTSLLVSLLATMASPSVAVAQSITDLGSAPNGQSLTPSGVSGDGSIIAGFGPFGPLGARPRAMRWTAAGGAQDLGLVPTDSNPWHSSFAFGTSTNGLILVGSSGTADGVRAVRWTSDGTGEILGTLGTYTRAFAANADGSVIVGSGNVDAVGSRGFRWTPAGGMQSLGVLPGGNHSYAQAVSQDGLVIAGWSTISQKDHAYLWTATGGMQDLGLLAGGTYSRAWGVSADGSVVVGLAEDSRGEYVAIRWSGASGMENLGVLAGDLFSYAMAVSADGSVVIGASGDVTGSERAFVWTPSLGMTDLRSYLVAQGVDLSGWILSYAAAVSADGSTIVGTGTLNGIERGWVASGLSFPAPIPAPGTVALLGLAGIGARRRRRGG